MTRAERQHMPASAYTQGYNAVDLKGRLQTGLFNRMRCRPYYSPDEYAKAFAAHEGQEVRVTGLFMAPGGPHAFNVELDGKLYHCPRLYIDVEGVDA